MVNDEVLNEFFKIARESIERLDRAVQVGMRSAHRAHGLYSDCPHGAASVVEAGLVLAVFTALMEQQYPERHRVEVRHEYPYSQPSGPRMDLALLEPGPNGAPTLGACIETKWWIAVKRESGDVAKMRVLCPKADVRKLMLLAWGLPGDSKTLAEWVEPQAREIGLILRPSWCDSFPAAVYRGAREFLQEGRLWLALMEMVAT